MWAFVLNCYAVLGVVSSSAIMRVVFFALVVLLMLCTSWGFVPLLCGVGVRCTIVVFLHHTRSFLFLTNMQGLCEILFSKQSI